MERRRFLQDLVERRGRAMEEEEKERKKTWSTIGKRKGKVYEDILSQNHLNTPLTCNYQNTLDLSVLYTPLILFPCYADMS
jgi:protein-disulfide isomerase